MPRYVTKAASTLRRKAFRRLCHLANQFSVLSFRFGRWQTADSTVESCGFEVRTRTEN